MMLAALFAAAALMPRAVAAAYALMLQRQMLLPCFDVYAIDATPLAAFAMRVAFTPSFRHAERLPLLRLFSFAAINSAMPALDAMPPRLCHAMTIRYAAAFMRGDTNRHTVCFTLLLLCHA